MPLAVLPDAELLTVEFLRSRAEVAALVATRVWPEMPINPSFPALRVQRIGGAPRVPRRLDGARIQVEAWGTTETTGRRDARTLAATAHAALWEMAGVYATGVVTGIDEDLGLTWSPDRAVVGGTARPRFLFGVVVFAHPL